MANLTVWKFSTAEGAEQAFAKLQGLQKEHLIGIVDAALVSWPAGKKKPKTRQTTNLNILGVLDGAFWGMLFGLIFFIPLVGLAVGALTGALAGHFRLRASHGNHGHQQPVRYPAGGPAIWRRDHWRRHRTRLLRIAGP